MPKASSTKFGRPVLNKFTNLSLAGLCFWAVAEHHAPFFKAAQASGLYAASSSPAQKGYRDYAPPADFRNHYWGMSTTEVIKGEDDAEYIDRICSGGYCGVSMQTKLLNQATSLLYLFYLDRLVLGAYMTKFQRVPYQEPLPRSPDIAPPAFKTKAQDFFAKVEKVLLQKYGNLDDFRLVLADHEFNKGRYAKTKRGSAFANLRCTKKLCIVTVINGNQDPDANIFRFRKFKKDLDTEKLPTDKF